MAKERVTYLDMAKGVGILLVILGHEADLPLAARQFVTSFHMPLFFILSGMAVCLTGEKERPFSQILKRKSRSILRGGLKKCSVGNRQGTSLGNGMSGRGIGFLVFTGAVFWRTSFYRNFYKSGRLEK